MVERNINYPGLRIVEYIGTSNSILFDGRDMIPLLGNLQCLSMGYKHCRNSIDGIPRSLDRWNMLSEYLESKGGIMSRRR
jgi:hypothetical protein